MEQIQATITITLTKEQLISLLTQSGGGKISDSGRTSDGGRTSDSGGTNDSGRIPPTPPSYSVQDLMLAARPLAESGRQQELLALLAEFGVPSVAAIPEDKRADFAARLRAMGGQI